MIENPPGLYQKYDVFLKNGHPVEKNVFVLFPEQDPHALRALREYAQSCRKENSELAIDLLSWINNIQDLDITGQGH